MVHTANGVCSKCVSVDAALFMYVIIETWNEKGET